MLMASFDFDDTLSRMDVQRYAIELISNGVELWICTSRHMPEETGNQQDILSIASNLNIPRERMIFTKWCNKWAYLKDYAFSFHLDDDFEELDMINKNTGIVGISSWGTSSWKIKCNKTLAFRKAKEIGESK